ncbi:MAG: AfsR/SARP family transcriptional regulator, partial [Stackebrandtia sp.]
MTDAPLCRVLGPVRVEMPTTSSGMGSPQQRLVLAVLALAEGRTVATTKLFEVLWDTEPPGSALVTLRSYISRLRNALEPSMVETSETGYALRGVMLDVAEARRLDATSRTATTAHRARGLLERALELWTGEPMAGLSGRWAEAQRLRLSDYRVRLLER